MSFRKFLVWVRKTYNMMPNSYLLFSFLGVIVFSLGGFLLDYFLPFSAWWNVLRSLVALPLGLSIFLVGYAFSINLHRQRVLDDEGWVAYRERFSPVWRRRISIIVGAFLIVIAYASGDTYFYTITTGLIIATAIGLFAFMRLTRAEQIQESYGLPDLRDINFENRRNELAREREKAEALANKKKSARRKKLITLGAIDETEVEVIEEDSDHDDISGDDADFIAHEEITVSEEEVR